MKDNTSHQLNKTMPYGYASLVWNPRTQNLVVTLSLTGLAAGSVYSANISKGNCADAGLVVYPLLDVLADSHGNAFTTTTISGVAMGVPASGWCIYVQRIADPDAPDQPVQIYCGDIVNPSPHTNHVQIIKVRLA